MKILSQKPEKKNYFFFLLFFLEEDLALVGVATGGFGSASNGSLQHHVQLAEVLLEWVLAMLKCLLLLQEWEQEHLFLHLGLFS